MTEEEALKILSAKGEESGSELHDGLNPQGWFGWDIQDNIITIRFEEAADEGENPVTEHRFALVPVEHAELLQKIFDQEDAEIAAERLAELEDGTAETVAFDPTKYGVSGQ